MAPYPSSPLTQRSGLSLRATFLSLLFFLTFFASVSQAQECSKTKLCETGCCSQHGYCGDTSAHCGSGCLSTCDWKAPETECSATKLCEIGCCSSSGFCGTTSAHCGTGCQSTCDYVPPDTECDESKPCEQGCCSKHGHCGYGEDCELLYLASLQI